MISDKQLEILKFPYEEYDVLACDGAVRSGKTSIMFLTFIDWAMNNFNGKLFGVVGKTFGVAEKNIIKPYIALTYARQKYRLQWKRVEKVLVVKKGLIENEFEVSGAKDESSYQLIQGRTYAGAFGDEVALFPQSFFDMLLSRCSVEGSRLWFSSNPSNPRHWYYTDWICQKERRRMKYVHFKLTDNPSLSEKTIQRYMSQYDGIFYQRYILGEWVSADGLVYEFKQEYISEYEPTKASYYLSYDYGIVNPFACYLWAIEDNKAYCLKEYYYDCTEHNQIRRTDEEHYQAIEEMSKDYNIQYIVGDPSATSFREIVNRHNKFAHIKAKNSVINGIATCQTYLKSGAIKFNPICEKLFEEFDLYSWDMDSIEDSVIKQDDHALDSFRYFVNTVLKNEIQI